MLGIVATKATPIVHCLRCVVLTRYRGVAARVLCPHCVHFCVRIEVLTLLPCIVVSCVFIRCVTLTVNCVHDVNWPTLDLSQVKVVELGRWLYVQLEPLGPVVT